MPVETETNNRELNHVQHRKARAAVRISLIVLPLAILGFGGWWLADEATAVTPVPDGGGHVYVLTNPPHMSVGVDYMVSERTGEVEIDVHSPGSVKQRLSELSKGAQTGPQVTIVLAGNARFRDLATVCTAAKETLDVGPNATVPTCSTVTSQENCELCESSEPQEFQVFTFEELAPNTLNLYGILRGKTIGTYVTSGGDGVSVVIPKVELYSGSIDSTTGQSYHTFDLATMKEAPDGSEGWGAPRADTSTLTAEVKDTDTDLQLVESEPAFSSTPLRLWGDCLDSPDCTNPTPRLARVDGLVRFRDPGAARTNQIFLLLAGVLLGVLATVVVQGASYTAKLLFRRDQ
jgi:hypothetical protein